MTSKEDTFFFINAHRQQATQQNIKMDNKAKLCCSDGISESKSSKHLILFYQNTLDIQSEHIFSLYV